LGAHVKRKSETRHRRPIAPSVGRPRSVRRHDKFREPRHIEAFRPAGETAPDGVPAAIHAWDTLCKKVPQGRRHVEYLADTAGLRRAQVWHLYEVRTYAAHPAEYGWPSQADINRALDTARSITKKLG
jgi:hypothetical protein